MVDSTVLAAILGGLIGSLGTFGVHYFYQWKKENRARQKLRKAFRKEIEHVEEIRVPTEEGFKDITELEDFKAEEVELGTPFSNFFPRTVYEEKCGELGLLEGEEIEKIVSYYSGVRLLENFRRELLEVERDKAKEIKTLWLGIYYKNLKKIMSDRKEALKYIKERGEN